jgi:hypothetical protein
MWKQDTECYSRYSRYSRFSFVVILLNSDHEVLLPEDILRKSLMRRKYMNESEIMHLSFTVHVLPLQARQSHAGFNSPTSARQLVSNFYNTSRYFVAERQESTAPPMEC